MIFRNNYKIIVFLSSNVNVKKFKYYKIILTKK